MQKETNAVNFTFLQVKLNDTGKLDIKNARSEFCERGNHTYNSIENERLLFFLQQPIANIAGRRGHFGVEDVLLLLHSQKEKLQK